MATRAPRGDARPRGGQASRPRPANPQRRQAGPGSSGAGSGRGGGGRKPPQKGGRRPGTGRKPAGKGKGAAARKQATSPVAILGSWLWHAGVAAWMATAHAAGFAARAYGKHARDLDDAHRRDGLGLAFLAAAVLSAAVTWGHLGSGLGRLLGHVIRGSFGRGALAIPVLLGLLAWRLLRHPDRNSETARVVIGWSALLVGALGLVHVANGTPGPSAGAPALRAAGGLIGFAVSAPLVAGLTAWVAVPVLALVTGFGVLVITGTPVHQIGTRLAEFRALLQGRRLPPPASAMPGEEGDPLRRPLPRAGGAASRWRPATTSGRTTPRCSAACCPGRAARPAGTRRRCLRVPAGPRPGSPAAGRGGTPGMTRRKRACPGPGRLARAGPPAAARRAAWTRTARPWWPRPR